MLHWIVCLLYTLLVERFRTPLFLLHREVQALTQKDRDIMDWLHFLCVLERLPTSHWQQ